MKLKDASSLDSILRDITFPRKVCIVKALVFPVKKAESLRTDAFELWCWRRILRVPWTARRSNQSILKEINPEYSILRADAEGEAPILWPPDAKSWLNRKDCDAGKNWKQEENGETEDEMVGWHHWLNENEFQHALEMVKNREAWHAAVLGVAKSLTQLSDWMTTNVKPRWVPHGLG